MTLNHESERINLPEFLDKSPIQPSLRKPVPPFEKRFSNKSSNQVE